MRPYLQNFLNVNIGHVAVIIVFIFGLGITRGKDREEVALIRADMKTQSDAIKAQVDGSRVERELKLELVRLQIKTLESRVAALEQERAEQRSTASRLATMEAKLQGIDDSLKLIQRKL